MLPFSFIHAADLHLDSPFSSLAKENADIASVMRSASFTSFENIIELCISKNVDFFLVAGDVYDGEERSLRAQVRFRDGLKKLSDAGIESFIVHGNHDPLMSWSATLEWPDRVYIFGDHISSIKVIKDKDPLAVIQGISHHKKNETGNLSLMFNRTDRELFHIGLLHATLGSNTGHEPYAPCSIEDLKKSGMDYWALGHVHERKIVSAADPAVVYPGNSQGRSIRETEEKGCYLVTVDDQYQISTEFISACAVKWVKDEADVSGISTEQELINFLEQRCLKLSENELSKPVIVRFELTGAGPMSKTLMNTAAVDDLLEIARDAGVSCSPFVWVEKISVKTSPELDINTLIEQEDFTGELLRLSEELLSSDNLEQFIKEELSLLYEESRAGKFVALPDKEEAVSLLKAARNICLESLLKGGLK